MTYQEYLKNYDANKEVEKIVAWIRNWLEENGKDCNIIVGISGGVDSSVVAALAVKAIGVKHVFGVMMPNGTQHDQDCARKLIAHLGIKGFETNIAEAYNSILGSVETSISTSLQTQINLGPRLRMATLYAYSQSLFGRVANTCNLSEDWVGYSTRYGDAAGDFAPLGGVTKTEVRMIGHALGLPADLVEKVPIDGLSRTADGSYVTDEGKMGFSYAVLDEYIRTGNCEDPMVKAKIDAMHQKNLFKMKMMDAYDPIPMIK